MQNIIGGNNMAFQKFMVGKDLVDMVNGDLVIVESINNLNQYVLSNGLVVDDLEGFKQLDRSLALKDVVNSNSFSLTRDRRLFYENEEIETGELKIDSIVGVIDGNLILSI